MQQIVVKEKPFNESPPQFSTAIIIPLQASKMSEYTLLIISFRVIQSSSL